MLKGQIPLTSVRPTQPTVNSNLALGRPVSASSTNPGYAAANAVDGNVWTYWESVNNVFPQWIQVDLGAVVPVGRVVLELPPSWPSRTQTLSVLGSVDGSSFVVLSASASRLFAPSASISFASSSARFVRLQISANTGWPAGQLAGFGVYSG